MGLGGLVVNDVVQHFLLLGDPTLDLFQRLVILVIFGGRVLVRVAVIILPVLILVIPLVLIRVGEACLRLVPL